MMAMPPVAPVVGWTASPLLPRDHYVRVDSNDYSVHPGVVGRRVQVLADLDQVVVTCAGTVVAAHERCWGRRQTIPDADHAQAAAALRAAHRERVRRPVETDVAVRELADYDRIFGLQDDLDDHPSVDVADGEVA
jgi:hypothetical protein